MPLHEAQPRKAGIERDEGGRCVLRDDGAHLRVIGFRARVRAKVSTRVRAHTC